MMHHSSVAENIAVAILMSLMVICFIVVALTQSCRECEQRKDEAEARKQRTCIKGLGWPKTYNKWQSAEYNRRHD